jgi:hypothetical protein
MQFTAANEHATRWVNLRKDGYFAMKIPAPAHLG